MTPNSIDTYILNWISENRPQIVKVRVSECSGDVIEIDTPKGTWRGKSLRKAVLAAMKDDPKLVKVEGH